MNTKRFLHSLLALMAPVMLCAAQQVESDPVRVYFRLGKSALERGYMNNAEALDELAERLEPYVHDSLNGRGRVRISSSVSPEGSFAINDRLIKARAKSISDWVGERFDVEVGYIIDSMGVDWTSLISLVEESDKVPFQQEVLNILRNTPEEVSRGGEVIGARQQQLERLRGGEPYRYIYNNFYPQLRYAAAYTDIFIVPELKITSPELITLGVEGGSGVVTYQREERDSVLPEVSSEAEWVSNIQVDDSKVTFDVEPNAVAKSRRATVVIDHYDIIHKVEVEQEGAEASLTFTTPTEISVEAEGGRHAVSFATNTEQEVVPTFECTADWISDIKASNHRLALTVTANSIAEPRSAVIRLSALGRMYEVVVNQLGADPKARIVNEAGDAIANPHIVVDRSESVKVYFRQGSAVLDQNYMQNDEALKRISELLQPYVVEDAEQKGKVRISSSVSPEGSNSINERLVKARAAAISKWISSRFDVEIGYVVDNMGVDWTSLISLVEESDEVPYKEEVLDILYNTPEQATRNGRVVNERQQQLERLRGGEPYSYLLKHIYPKLRYAAAYSEIWYASELFIITESPMKFTSDGGDGVITLEKNVEDKVVPRASSAAEWISGITPESHKVGFVVAENPMVEERGSKVYIECYGKVYEVDVIQEGAEPVLILAASEKTCGAEGGDDVIPYTVNTVAEVTPEAESTSEWISNVTTTSDGISYTVAPNEVAEPRTDTIKVTCFDKVQDVIVRQEGAEPELTFTVDTPRDIIYKGMTDTLTFKTNTPEKVVPTATSEAEWIKNIAPTDSLITYDVARNRSEEPRSATIAVESFGKTQNVTVNQEAAPECDSSLYLAIKTNALYDLALIPNIGAEIHLGKNFTIGANWHYAWWKSDSALWYWRTYGGDLNARFWFGEAAKRKPLTGHHVGLYGQILTYDFLVGSGKGILADRWSWSVGAEYGYSWPLAERLNLDVTLGVGYHTGQFYEYMPIDDCYVWQATKNRKYIGPTKLEVSLVWLFGCANTNDMKGGDR